MNLYIKFLLENFAPKTKIFIKDNFMTIFVLTLFNLFLFSYVYHNFLIFLIREFYILILVGLAWKYKREIKLIREDSKHFDSVLFSHYPVLKYVVRLLIVGLLTLVVSLTFFLKYEEGYYIFVCGALLINASLFLYFYRLYAIWSIPELSDSLNIIKSIKIYGVRSFSTTSKIVLAGEKIGVTTVVALSGGILFFPKIINLDPDLRSSLQDFLSKHYTQSGFTSSSEYNVREANKLYSQYPELRDQMVGKDGHQVDINAVAKINADKNKTSLPPRETFVSIEHQVKHGVGGIGDWRPGLPSSMRNPLAKWKGSRPEK